MLRCRRGFINNLHCDITFPNDASRHYLFAGCRVGGERICKTRRTLHDEPAMVKPERAKSGKLFSASGAPRTTMKTGRDDVAMTGVLGANGSVHNHNSSV